MNNIKDFKDIHKGKTAFIIGSGPSLNEQDLTYLTKNKEIVIGCNLTYKKIKPTYYCIANRKTYENNKDEIDSLECPKLFGYPNVGSLYPKGKENVYDIFLDNNKFTWNGQLWDFDEGFTVHGESVVTDLCIPLAHYMGITTIYLLGVDCTDYGHFYDNFYYKHNWNNIFGAFKVINDLFINENKKLYNATKGGKLELLERIDYEKIPSIINS